MSQFFASTQSEYLRRLFRFLGCTHPAVKQLRRGQHGEATGSALHSLDTAVQVLEQAVNQLARRCEDSDTHFHERLSFACAYVGLSDAALGKKLGVYRRVTSDWRYGSSRPTDIDRLAEVLHVPAGWLQYGGEGNLPASSHVGIRVGDEASQYREQLYAVTLDALQDVSDDAQFDVVNAVFGETLLKDPVRAKLSRRAGGRWLISRGRLVFVSWRSFDEQAVTGPPLHHACGETNSA